MLYFDSSYVVRLYLSDPGWHEVRTLAAANKVACSIHGRAEVIAAFHRKFREGTITHSQFSAAFQQFEADSKFQAFAWLSFSETVLAALAKVFSQLPATVHLRAADAMHLASAKENAFKEIFSNDKQLLKAAGYFGLMPRNVF